MPAPRIVVVGSANTDLIVKVPRIPAPGQTVLGGNLVRACGGKGANQAVAAARLGAQVTFIGCVGTDDFGDAYMSQLQSESLDTRFVHRDDSRPSGVALIFVAPDGENSIAVAPGANLALAPPHVDAAREAFAAADVVLAQLEVPLDAVIRTAELAHELGVPFILNPAPVSDPPPAELVSLASVLTPNRHEAAALVGRDAEPEQLAHALAEQGAQLVVITLGADGALFAHKGIVGHVPAFRVHAVDATGAGDCFSAALAVATAEGAAPAEAVRFANAAAALSATKLGAQPSMPTRAEVDALIADCPLV